MVKEAAPPRVFISYSHDSEAHSAWVLALVKRLNSEGMVGDWRVGKASLAESFVDRVQEPTGTRTNVVEAFAHALQLSARRETVGNLRSTLVIDEMAT